VCEGADKYKIDAATTTDLHSTKW